MHVKNTALIHVALPSVRDLKLPEIATVHGRLAASLALWYTNQRPHDYDLWQKVWPSQQDFKNTMPLYYPKRLQNLLPHAAKTLLTNQRTNLDKDWSNLQPFLPSISKDLFTYTWLIVNTRTFYWDYPDLPNAHARLPKRRNKLTANDCYAMCPLIDYFNHASTGCNPTHTATGYTITADRNYPAGTEILISYGPHTNDFLLAEYGFLLPTNPCDAIPLDPLLLPLLDPAHVSALKQDGFYAKYTLSRTQPVLCHRTQVMLRLLVLDSKRYAAFVSGGGDDDDGGGGGGARDQRCVNEYLVAVLQRYARRVGEVLEEVEGGGGGGGGEEEEDDESGDKAATLARRWKQILGIVNGAVEVLEGGE